MIARLFAWLRRHQGFVDLMLMLPIAVVAFAARPSYVHLPSNGIPRTIPLALHLTLVVTLCLPLVWRRRWPRAVFAVIALASFAQWLAGITIAASNIAVMVAMYTIASQCAFRWALASGLVVELGAVMAIFSIRQNRSSPGDWKTLIPFSIFIGAVWLCGLYISTRRKYTLSLEERARRLERERDAQAEVAAAAERARIARELHDVIAHSISVMVVQADGASYMIDSDSTRARRAMEAIGTTGRHALMEMRRMLGVLREDGEATLAPQPGVDQITELIGQIRSAGLPVALTVTGAPGSLATGLELTIYRIIQEALTNVLKHAGPAADARVDLEYGEHLIEVQVRDNGRGATRSDGRGHGLVGMRERAAVYGGDVLAEPAPGGGFRVIARLPVKEGVKT
jgi:signal transduction histidine kinase